MESRSLRVTVLGVFKLSKSTVMPKGMATWNWLELIIIAEDIMGTRAIAASKLEVHFLYFLCFLLVFLVFWVFWVFWVFLYFCIFVFLYLPTAWWQLDNSLTFFIRTSMQNLDSVAHEMRELCSILRFGGHFVFQKFVKKWVSYAQFCDLDFLKKYLDCPYKLPCKI